MENILCEKEATQPNFGEKGHVLKVYDNPAYCSPFVPFVV